MRRKPWTLGEVESELLVLSKELGHCPSFQDLRDLGRNDLAVQISRKGGFTNIAKRLGLKRPLSQSDLGWEGEDKIISILERKGFIITKSLGVKSPYDLIVNDVLRIDVKTTSLTTYTRNDTSISCGWFYRLGKYVQSDIIILYQKDTEICYIIPWWECTTSNITITKTGGKYIKYRDNFDLLKSMIETRRLERESIG